MLKSIQHTAVVALTGLVLSVLPTAIATAQVLIRPELPKYKPVTITNGQVLQTASPTALPLYVSIRPSTKPNPPAKVSKKSGITFGQENGLTEWVMPSRKYVATAAEVGTPGSMLCNITFDDGPHPKYDPQILEILSRYNARATFYLVGQNVKRFPDTTRMIANRGHEIGHHSWKHDNLKKIGRSAIHRDLERTSSQIKSVVGYAPRVFRPPYGNHTGTVINKAKDLGMETLLWTVDSLDWKRSPPSKTAKRVLDRTKPGAVILLHSIHKQTVQALPSIMDGLVQKGCRFVTSTEWIAAVTQ